MRSTLRFCFPQRRSPAHYRCLLTPTAALTLRVVRSQRAHLNSQWFADQGFAVVICDGRGTPGRGSSWERAVYGDLAPPVLDDQVTALDIAAKHCETHLGCTLDLSRVAIRGWSFGGYLSALAVMRRPDRFHVAVAGAPVTEWRWYDTHYTERYLGNPAVDDTAYRRSCSSKILRHSNDRCCSFTVSLTTTLLPLTPCNCRLHCCLALHILFSHSLG